VTKLSLRPTKKTVVTLAVVLCLVIAAGGFLCAMQARELGSLSAELGTKKAKLLDDKELSHKLSAAVADLEDAKYELSHLERGVIEPDYIPTLLIQLDDLARSSGLAVEGVKVEQDKAMAPPTAPKKPSENQPEGSERGVSLPAEKQAQASLPYKERILSVEVKGGFERVVEFVRKLTTFPKIVSIDGIKVDASRDRLSGGDPALNVTISLKVYIWRGSQGTKEADQSGE
jgi:Tfp pilus assembly protein PilO